MTPISAAAINSVQPAPQASAGQPSLMSELALNVSQAGALEDKMGATLDQIGLNGIDTASLMQLLGDSQKLELLTAMTASTVASLKEAAEQVLRRT